MSPKLDELHVRHASRIYLDAKRELGISADRIPQLRHLSEHLKARTGMHLVPAEGPIAYRIFYGYIADGGFPCTQFIRHGSQPEYTPEPDMIHDCLGHVPPLLNHDYAELLTDDRQAAVRAASRRPRAGAEAAELVLDRVRPDRGGGRDARVRGRHPVVDRRDPVLAVGQRRAPALRDRPGDRDRLRLDEDAGTALRHPVVRLPAKRGGVARQAVGDRRQLGCPMRDPYGDLAPLYNLMTADPGIQAFYREFRAALTDAARAYGIRPGIIVDLACGTGNTAIPWAGARGRTVIGVDRSEAMLRMARRKSSRVRWVRQDATRLRLDVHADVVTCHFDALNHVLESADLQRVFDRVAATLRPGGLFLFDLNTRFFLQWLSTSEKLFRVGPHSFTAYNAFDSKSGIATFNQLWFVKRGRLYQQGPRHGANALVRRPGLRSDVAGGGASPRARDRAAAAEGETNPEALRRSSRPAAGRLVSARRRPRP